MAHMSADQAKDIRNRLKEAFPPKEGWKLSVKKSSGSRGIDVAFLAGPFFFEEYDESVTPALLNAPDLIEAKQKRPMTRAQINEYHLDRLYPKATAEVLKKAHAIIARDHWDKSDSMTDYFCCAYYIDIAVGRWNQPYAYQPAKEKA